MSGRPADLPAVVCSEALAGGDVAEISRALLADGREAVVKTTPYDARLEAEGLRALGGAGATVPAVWHADADLLVLEHLSLRPDPEALAAELVAVHRTTGPAHGWHRDNVIGPLPQANGWADDYPTLFVERRLRPHLQALPAALRTRLEEALPVIADRIAHDAQPSLLHGDLWGGNVLDGRALIDPAVHHGDREADLAMLALFGAPPRLVEAYLRRWPLDDGADERRPLLQLAPLLVHARLFGAAYHAPIAARLDAIDH